MRDSEKDVYFKILQKFMGDGLTFFTLLGKKFQSLSAAASMNKALKEKMEKLDPKFDTSVFESVEANSVPFQYILPSSSRANLIKARAQKRYSIRELIYELFPLYKDDRMKLEIKFRNHSAFSKEGTINDLNISASVLLELLNKVAPTAPEMMEINIKLLEKGESRIRHEEISNMMDTDQELVRISSNDSVSNLFKGLSIELAQERSKLVGVSNAPLSEGVFDYIESNMKGFDLEVDDISELRSIIKFFGKNYPNEELIKDKDDLGKELTKMEEWLDKSHPGNASFGKNRFY